ncbi:MAG: hypothetical protein GC185_13640 [Alphaproteobacteria bacterium]|nr:hypothetical protein [Alphaproteobacteria bacterium]
MSPEDKQRLKDAFQRAIDRDPAGADRPFKLQGLEGDFTMRQIIRNTVSSEAFYADIEQKVAAGVKSFDDFVAEFEQLKMPAPPAPPKGPQR